MAGIGDPKYGGVWEQFRSDLEHLDYATGSKIVCTSRFGIPQFRKRSILMGARRELVRAGRFADILQQELLVPEADPNSRMVSAAQAIGHLPPIAAGEVHATRPQSPDARIDGTLISNGFRPPSRASRTPTWKTQITAIFRCVATRT